MSECSNDGRRRGAGVTRPWLLCERSGRHAVTRQTGAYPSLHNSLQRDDDRRRPRRPLRPRRRRRAPRLRHPGTSFDASLLSASLRLPRGGPRLTLSWMMECGGLVWERRGGVVGGRTDVSGALVKPKCRGEGGGRLIDTTWPGLPSPRPPFHLCP